MQQNLFHYTDALAIKSILENRELWLSDIRFLNDSQEMNDGVKYIVEALVSDLPDVGLSVGGTLYARDYLMEAFDDHISYGIDSEPTFVCSFSEAGNQLSQWRAYGGYAIEFDRELIQSALDLFVCIYNDEEKKHAASYMVREAIHELASDIEKHGEVSPEGVMCLSMLVRTASIFKDQSFYEEKEVRCAVDIPLPDSELKFRSRGGLLIPYVTLAFPFAAIKAIHVGPMRDQELAFTSMKALVSNVTHDFISNSNESISEINVVMSKIPYRAP